jgi:hypothetical protein
MVLGLALVLGALLFPGLLLSGELVPVDRWYLSVGGVAAAIFGICLRRGAATFGMLAFVLIVGGAAQLYKTEALWFSAIQLTPRNWKDVATAGAIALEAAVALAVLVRVGLPAVVVEADRRLGIGRLVLFVLISAILSVPVLGFLGRGAGAAYGVRVVLAVGLTLVHLIVFAAMSQVKSPISGLYRLSPLVPATLTLGVGICLAFWSFERLPHVEDEVAYLFQAKTFAGGALTVPAPPEALWPGLDYYLFEIQDGRWYSATVPGWPAALALGVLVDAPWLVNPLLAALSVLLAHRVAARLAGRDQADLVAMMMGASPWLLAMSASMMPHTLTLFLMLGAWALILGAGDAGAGALRRLFVAGLAMGWIFATRPLDGVLVGGLTGLWLLLIAPQGGPGRALIYGLGCLATGGLLLAYNAAITGSALDQPLTHCLDRLWAEGANAYGFGPQIGPPGGWGALDLWPGHSLTEALVNTLNVAVNLQFDMMGWTVGSLALVLACLLWHRPDRTDIAMGALVAVIVLAMALYWFADSYYIGPRYWFLAAFPLFFLSARGFEAIRARFADNPGAQINIEALLWYACIFGLCVFLPWRAVTKYHEYGNYHPTVRAEAASGRFDGQIVLVEKVGNEGSALMLNDPWLRGTIYLNDTGQLDEAAIAAALPGRKIIRYRPDWK